MKNKLKIFLLLFLYSQVSSHRYNLRLPNKVPRPPHADKTYVTTELHKIIRWKSQPSFYTAPMEYQEVHTVAAPHFLKERLRGDRHQENVTARSWTPISIRNKESELSKPIVDIFEPKDYDNYDQKEKAIKTNSAIDEGVGSVLDIAELKNFSVIEDGKEICPHFKYGKVQFKIDSLPGTWQTAYYSLPDKIECFKITVKKVTERQKMKYSRRYGSFDGLVNWSECNLEISPAYPNGQKHFLQGVAEDDGIMDNVIIDDFSGSDGLDSSLPTIHEENADQWLVYKNMLLLRDCDNGGVVVFSKYPTAPTQKQVEEALEAFGETKTDGQLACEGSTRNYDSDAV